MKFQEGVDLTWQCYPQVNSHVTPGQHQIYTCRVVGEGSSLITVQEGAWWRFVAHKYWLRNIYWLIYVVMHVHIFSVDLFTLRLLVCCAQQRFLICLVKVVNNNSLSLSYCFCRTTRDLWTTTSSRTWITTKQRELTWWTRHGKIRHSLVFEWTWHCAHTHGYKHMGHACIHTCIQDKNACFQFKINWTN